ncbi:hypothetical protein TREMEDRAFT_65839 [Tremella mesenterica DSM 1558]|uniref:uncharacterized protein n=1 Tax=Tremella mesenterica (strain ATCC 24925 / CBS 8224 / DSM 1558 / NBRC 9311 / NRRL Y-6157 / RJB 2259-6 / UBC 559-6) TaxID=578456 RepID=UPI00032C7F34|nr:uncharacterized protein TREMEDRAFT_65839 [Tremella mesenterica DSM 1558]EIW66228.1 hypothetical protein TREMEDRAFT_65839 [Tremella mesenterica DSM 1558]
MTLPILPLEILQLIASHLSSSRKLATLSLLTLLSRDTYPLIIPYLYTTIEITEPTSISLLEPLLIICDMYEDGLTFPSNITSLTLTLPHTSSQSLTDIKGKSKEVSSSTSNQQNHIHPLDLPLEIRRLYHLSKIKRIIIKDMLYGYLFQKLKDLCENLDDKEIILFPSVTKLIISVVVLERIKRAEISGKRFPGGLWEFLKLSMRPKDLCLTYPDEPPRYLIRPECLDQGGGRGGGGGGGGAGGRSMSSRHVQGYRTGRVHVGPRVRPSRPISPPPPFESTATESSIRNRINLSALGFRPAESSNGQSQPSLLEQNDTVSPNAPTISTTTTTTTITTTTSTASSPHDVIHRGDKAEKTDGLDTGNSDIQIVSSNHNERLINTDRHDRPDQNFLEHISEDRTDTENEINRPTRPLPSLRLPTLTPPRITFRPSNLQLNSQTSHEHDIPRWIEELDDTRNIIQHNVHPFLHLPTRQAANHTIIYLALEEYTSISVRGSSSRKSLDCVVEQIKDMMRRTIPDSSTTPQSGDSTLVQDDTSDTSVIDTAVNEDIMMTSTSTSIIDHDSREGKEDERGELEEEGMKRDYGIMGILKETNRTFIFHSSEWTQQVKDEVENWIIKIYGKRGEIDGKRGEIGKGILRRVRFVTKGNESFCHACGEDL